MSLEKSAGPTSGTRRSSSMTRMDRAPRTSSISSRKRLRHDDIDNAEPVIDDVTRREQVRDAMKHYCKRRKYDCGRPPTATPRPPPAVNTLASTFW